MIKSLSETRQYLEDLDLSYIVEDMCRDDYPLPRWVKTDAERCCRLYKDFLLLKKKHPNQALVPTREIDEFWHNHILYTENYFHDCQQIFGHYLHHHPASRTENLSKLTEEFIRTKALYLEEFARPLTLIS